MKEQLMNLKASAEKMLGEVDSTKGLEEIRLKFLGKKGELTSILRGMGGLSAEERPVVGQVANTVREFIEEAVANKSSELEKIVQEKEMEAEKLDVTMPGKRPVLGKRHPLMQVVNEVEEIFLGLGYKIAEGPEIEFDYYNFEALNLPKDHPARDTQDTFYITDNILLRSQTSPVQVRVMENEKPPIKIICPGKVYRSDAVDATHSPVFHQIEGLVVDKNITMGDLKGTLEMFAREFFGGDTKIRLRPHHFPFTEPSCEVDVTCWTCGGDGCRTCKDEGWVEILGAGMVHPWVLNQCGIDPEIYSGFAFGMGVERITLAKYGINDIRLLFENDKRFLRQF